MSKIFITGITGTLGTAFTHYLINRGHTVSGIDHNEERVVSLQHAYPTVSVRLGDFGDVDFQQEEFDVVIHLAAMKHIDLCEDNPSSAITNNVIKTYNLFKNARAHGIGILFMSTDKAVEPTSVYGYTKALMEKVTLELGGAFVRSGNIIASNGSVVDVWEKAIQEGRPLRLTHIDMRRFFITPEHLVERAWEAFSRGEKTIIPEMDMDISLMDLADKKLKEHGESVTTYPIEFTGLRKGEKLVEKLKGDNE
jgi:UDP-N-acetyl-D-glucosamine 4,6-dehydratase